LEINNIMEEVYYIYHIPGKKIGVTRDLNNRVTLVQGYKPGEYEVLDSSSDINYISGREIELQKIYGYKIDRTLYKNLVNKMKINATEQTSTFPFSKKELSKKLDANIGLKWKTSLGEFEISDLTVEWIKANSYASMFDKKRSYIYNKAYYEAFLANSKYNHESMFDLIRQWASDRDIYSKGDIKTQLIKLYEETGELSKAVLDNDKEGIVDAIGDSIVVLTNLAEFAGTTVETCMQSAYDEISSRTGRMINGTFVKDK
jgi:NTP pyrophosphatase (non-canonical NTP hydrolase)